MNWTQTVRDSCLGLFNVLVSVDGFHTTCLQMIFSLISYLNVHEGGCTVFAPPCVCKADKKTRPNTNTVTALSRTCGRWVDTELKYSRSRRASSGCSLSQRCMIIQVCVWYLSISYRRREREGRDGGRQGGRGEMEVGKRQKNLSCRSQTSQPTTGLIMSSGSPSYLSVWIFQLHSTTSTWTWLQHVSSPESFSLILIASQYRFIVLGFFLQPWTCS